MTPSWLGENRRRQGWYPFIVNTNSCARPSSSISQRTGVEPAMRPSTVTSAPPGVERRLRWSRAREEGLCGGTVCGTGTGAAIVQEVEPADAAAGPDVMFLAPHHRRTGKARIRRPRRLVTRSAYRRLVSGPKSMINIRSRPDKPGTSMPCVIFEHRANSLHMQWFVNL